MLYNKLSKNICQEGSKRFKEYLCIDKITEYRNGRGMYFHKWCFNKHEFLSFLKAAGFTNIEVKLVTNVCFLSKFRLFRKQKTINESKARSEGFKLNIFGQIFYDLVKTIAPGLFGTTLIFTCLRGKK